MVSAHVDNKELVERLVCHISNLRVLAERLDESGAVLSFEDASAAQSLDFLHQSLVDLEVIVKNWASMAPEGRVSIARLVSGAKLEISIDAVSSIVSAKPEVNVGCVDLF